MPLVQTIFNWVIASSAMGSFIICMIVLVKLIFKNKLGAKWHYYLWVLLIFRLLLPYSHESSLSIFNVVHPLTENIFIGQNDSNNSWISERKDKEVHTGIYDNAHLEQDQRVENASVQPATGFYSKINFPLTVKSTLIALWLIGSLLTASYITFINIRLWLRIRIQPQVQSKTVNEIFDGCKSIMGVDRDIPVIRSSVIRTPCLFGFIKPQLLLPENILEKVSNGDLKYIFLHELAHYKRKDIIINWVINILKILHWFNPLIWWGFYQMHHDCEIACDALVLSSIKSEERVEYGYTIIRLLKIVSRQPWMPGTISMLTGGSQIKRRITMISLFKKETFAWSLVAIILFITLGFTGLTNANHERDIKNLQKSVNDMRMSNKADIENDSRYKELQKQLISNQVISGLTDIEGSGVIVTIADADSSAVDKKGNTMELIIHDVDIRNVVNELNNAGAEAISINEERLIATSQITASGAVIAINNERFGSPFVIKAIGNSEALESALRIKGGIIERLNAYGIKTKIEKSDKLFLHKYKRDINFKYAQPVNN